VEELTQGMEQAAAIFKQAKRRKISLRLYRKYVYEQEKLQKVHKELSRCKNGLN